MKKKVLLVSLIALTLLMIIVSTSYADKIFQYPLKNYRVSGPFVPNRKISNSRGAHLATDCTSTSGNTRVYPIYEGTVYKINTKLNSGAGRYIIIRHIINGITVYSEYQHLASVKVKVGAKVTKTTVIGIYGGSGTKENSYAKHLHYEIFTGKYSPWVGSALTGYTLNREIYSPVTYNGTTYYNADRVLKGTIPIPGVTCENPTTLQFQDVVYPAVYKIDTKKGWDLSGGIIVSKDQLKTLDVKILDSNNNVISSMKSPKTLSGYVFAIRDLDGTKVENGQKFSKITKAGTYYWVLTAKDAGNRELTLKMTIIAQTSGKTQTAIANMEYENDPTPAPTTPAPTTPAPTTPAPTTPAPTTPTPTTPAPTTPAPTTPAPTTPVPTSDNLEFQDVVYPSTFRINTSAGWNLVGGTVNSSKGLSSISTQIISVTGTVISKETTRSISGNTYNVKSLDTFESGDNGVKFSKITTAGHYIWVLTVTDAAGRKLTMQMPVNAVTSGSTVTQTMSKKYGEQEETIRLAFNNVVYPKTFKINTSAGWNLSGGTVTSGSGLALISTKIVNSSGSVISKETTRNISGSSYNIKSLDTFEAGDNGVKFSKIKTAGVYKWVLTVTDVLGRKLTLEMPFNAVTKGSTVTATASKQYGSKDSNPGEDLAPQEEDTKMTVTVDGLKYVLDKATLTATFIGMKNSSATSIIIPSTIEKKDKTYKVTKIEKNACKNATSLTKITIGKNVEEIGKKAFSGCKNLEKIS